MSAEIPIIDGQVAAADASHAVSVELALQHARRAFALKKYEQAVEQYATALELQTKKHQHDAPELADLYFSYGKALLENAISQASVLGKDPEPCPDVEGEHRRSKGTILEFGDEIQGEGEDSENGAVNLMYKCALELGEENDDEDEDEAVEGEPEDDFNAAWEVLELARSIYQKRGNGDDEIMLKLADTYITLGDVSLETEKFDQAISDYSTGLTLKVDLLPTASRQIAEAHYKLSMVLDLTPGRLADAIMHAEKAYESILKRIQELKDGLNTDLTHAEVGEQDADIKGKGKAVTSLALTNDLVKMTRNQMESELQELEGVKEDLALKVDELKTTPKAATESAPALAARVLDQELNTHSIAVPGQPAVVHDLTSMVKRKRLEGNPKRKVDEGHASSLTKKARLENTS